MKKKILIVDDNEDLNRSLQVSLNDTYATIAAKDGEEGLELALTEPPDLIIMDLMMPGTNGLEAIRLIRKVPKTRRIPIIAITGGLSSMIKDECSRIGCDDFLSKPFTSDQLVLRIEKLLQQPTTKAESPSP